MNVRLLSALSSDHLSSGLHPEPGAASTRQETSNEETNRGRVYVHIFSTWLSDAKAPSGVCYVTGGNCLQIWDNLKVNLSRLVQQFEEHRACGEEPPPLLENTAGV